MRLASCTATARALSFSSRPRRRTTPSVPPGVGDVLLCRREAMDDKKYEGEDAGFAINGGKGWKSVVFNNHQIESTALLPTRWVITSSRTRRLAPRSASSTPSATSAATMARCASACTTRRCRTRRRARPTSPRPRSSTAQKLWAESIASISKVYADKGDYVGAAGEAAGKLYGYGKSDVLFKPTKATKNPFRPDADSAMSYFVGAEAMKNDKFKGEDAGFAINGGKGWKSVTFNNHQISLNGPTAQAMGDYIFVDATSGDKVRVEYTFGYKRNDDGKVRIYLHHSSVPYATKRET